MQKKRKKAATEKRKVQEKDEEINKKFIESLVKLRGLAYGL